MKCCKYCKEMSCGAQGSDNISLVCKLEENEMSNEAKDWLRDNEYEPQFEEEEEDNVRYHLTEGACMQLVLKDFDIEVSIGAARGIVSEFMELMERQGYISIVENTDD